MASHTFSLTTEEIHQEINRWSGYLNECPTFFEEPSILCLTLPVLMHGCLDLHVRFLKAFGNVTDQVKQGSDGT